MKSERHAAATSTPRWCFETTFVTEAGEVSLVDFMPPGGENTYLVRLVKGIRGIVDMRSKFALRFDYGRTVPWVTQNDDELHAVAGPDMVVLRSATRVEDRIHWKARTIRPRANSR